MGNEKGEHNLNKVCIATKVLLTQYFLQILNYNFTAKEESEFDNIAKGKRISIISNQLIQLICS